MTRPELPLVLIAAVARNGVIGRDGAMPWRLPGDLAHFRAATMGKPVIMGRKTFEAIGRPLAGRHLVVLSHDPGSSYPGLEWATTVAEAVEAARAAGVGVGAQDVMVAGGAAVYAALMPLVETLLVTEVDLQPEGDARFPSIDPAVWALKERLPGQPRGEDDAAYCFTRYGRRATALAPAFPRGARAD